MIDRPSKEDERRPPRRRRPRITYRAEWEPGPGRDPEKGEALMIKWLRSLPER